MEIRENSKFQFFLVLLTIFASGNIFFQLFLNENLQDIFYILILLVNLFYLKKKKNYHKYY